MKRGRPGGALKTAIVALLCAVASPAPARAETAPQAFLTEILDHDFKGDGAFRVGKAIFTDGRSATIGDACCSVPREAFDPRSEPVELVAKWELAGAGTVTAREATLPVHFVAVAEIVGISETGPHRRQVKPLAAPRDVRVKYHLQRRGADWVLVNPPLPRVGLTALSGIVRGEIQQLEETMGRETADARMLEFHRKLRDGAAAELAELDDVVRGMKRLPE